MADPTWMDGRRIWILRVEDHRLIGWIDFSAHSWWTHHRPTRHSWAAHAWWWWSMLGMAVRVHLWVAVWRHHSMWMVGREHVWSWATHHVWGHHVAWAHRRSVHARWTVWWATALHVWWHHAWLVLAWWWSVLTWGAVHAVWTVWTWNIAIRNHSRGFLLPKD